MPKEKKPDFRQYDNDKDELNPRFMFRLTATKLLVSALKKELDVKYLIKLELANRGCDKNGKWVGFDKANEIHGIIKS